MSETIRAFQVLVLLQWVGGTPPIADAKMKELLSTRPHHRGPRAGSQNDRKKLYVLLEISYDLFFHDIGEKIEENETTFGK